MQRDFEKGARDSSSAISKSFGREMPKVERAIDKATAASGRFLVEQQKLNTMIEKGVKDKDRLIRQSERVSTAYRNEASALREVETSMKEVGAGARNASGGLQAVGAAIGSLSRIGGPVVIAGIATGLLELAQVAASASGALGLLPGAATAAGAAFGSLKLATLGFGEAIESIGDPEKFAESLQKLSPNARQAALSIQAMMPALTQLKNATQDAFFANVGPQLNQLTNTLLPTIQQLTTGVAGAFNEMFGALSRELMSPALQQDIGAIADNVVSAFRELIPAVAPLTQAFADLTAVGSDFLPDLARSVSTVAGEFAVFVREARESGKLHEWIQDGLNTMKELGSIALSVTQALAGMSSDQVRNQLAQVADAIKGIASSMDVLITSLRIARDISFPLVGAMDALGLLDKPADQSTGSSGRSEGFQNMFVPPALAPAGSGAGAPVGPGGPFNPMEVFGGPPGVPVGPPVGPGIIPGAPGAGYPLPANMRPTLGTGLRTGGLNAQTTHTWGNPPPTGAGSTISESERREAIRAGLDPNAFAVDPFAPIGPMPGMPGAPGGAPRLPGQMMPTAPGQIDPQQLMRAQHDIQSDAYDLQQSKMDLAVLEQDTLSTEKELMDARWKVQEDQWALQESQAKLTEEMHGTTTRATAAAEELGAALDADFGLSRGLPGLVENIVKTIANIAAAPLLGQLDAQQQLAAAQGQPQGGFGFMGIQGAQNMARGLSPIFGNPMPPGYGPAGYGPSAMGPMALQPGFGGGQPYGLPIGTNSGGYGSGGSEFPAWVHQLGNVFGVKPSTYPGHQEGSGLNKGIDWSGSVENMQRFADYLATIPGSLEQVIWQNPNTGQKTGIANGQFVGPGTSQPGYYAGDFGGHQDHVHTRQSFSLPIPGGGGGGMPPQWSADWNAIAQAESGGNWGIDTGNGYSGGLQFSPSSWAAAGGGQYAPSASQASPYHQALTAEQLLQMQGPGAWPNTFVPGSSGPGWGGPGLPPGINAGGGQSPVWGASPQGPGLGGSATPGGAMGLQQGTPGAGAGQSVIAGKQPSAQGGGGFQGLGGLPMDAMMGAASALDVMAPGAGQAAKTGIQLINRSIGFMGQLGAIGAGGLMETFMLSGGVDPMKTLPGRLISGFAGARPAVPNQAGQTQPPTGVDPNTQQHGQGGGQPPGPGAPFMQVENMNVGSAKDGKKVEKEANRQFQGRDASGWFGSR